MILKNNYSVKELIQNCIWLVRTKFISSKARLIRFPLTLRGERYIDFGVRLTTGIGCRLEAFNIDGQVYKKIIFGSDVQINDYVHISAMKMVEIGNNTLIASHVYISDNSHGVYRGGINDTSPDIPPKDRDYAISSVIIGNNVWLAEGVIIMPGVKIGDGAIIGAHSVVNKDIPSNVIAVGAPAKIVKYYSEERRCWLKINNK